jgi:hypothetical protein
LVHEQNDFSYRENRRQGHSVEKVLAAVGTKSISTVAAIFFPKAARHAATKGERKHSIPARINCSQAESAAATCVSWLSVTASDHKRRRENDRTSRS